MGVYTISGLLLAFLAKKLHIYIYMLESTSEAPCLCQSTPTPRAITKEHFRRRRQLIRACAHSPKEHTLFSNHQGMKSSNLFMRAK